MAQFSGSKDITHYLRLLNKFMVDTQNKIVCIYDNLQVAVCMMDKMSRLIKSEGIQINSLLNDWNTSTEDEQEPVEEPNENEFNLEGDESYEEEDPQSYEQGEEQMFIDPQPSTSKIKPTQIGKKIVLPPQSVSKRKQQTPIKRLSPVKPKTPEMSRRSTPVAKKNSANSEKRVIDVPKTPERASRKAASTSSMPKKVPTTPRRKKSSAVAQNGDGDIRRRRSGRISKPVTKHYNNTGIILRQTAAKNQNGPKWTDILKMQNARGYNSISERELTEIQKVIAREKRSHTSSVKSMSKSLSAQKPKKRKLYTPGLDDVYVSLGFGL